LFNRAGTSAAAPHVAGAAAVVESELDGDQSADRLRYCLFKGADDLGKPGTDKEYHKGRVNVLRAAACK
jgi:subtilisin family serine protease